jgi:fermentation-respiration switch protein FrsA (DUF1100 family)
VLVIVHPSGGFKEQTARLYAKLKKFQTKKNKLDQNGFTTICYDASNQSESTGRPHFLEDPLWRVSDIWSVVDYLEHLGSVDLEKIAVVGICARGGLATAAPKADCWLKALATISMVNIGDSARLGWDGNESPAKHVETQIRSAANQGGEQDVDYEF